MCGICGGYLSADRDGSTVPIDAMTSWLAHRGPDGSNTWSSADGRCLLGHTRLAVIDLEQGGQPMHSPDGRHTIVYNGEVYNFEQLKSELAGLGHAFRTRSDTEVVLAAYRQWGSACLEKFRGMFALAIYDSHDRELFLARDRTGIKPLYVARHRGDLYFASEIKSLLQIPTLPRRVDYAALADYLVLGYPLMPATMFADVRELRPGTWQLVSSDDTIEGEFWTWNADPSDADLETTLEATTDVLVESLREHLVADVPVGAFLSGGIDSSLLVSLLVKKLGIELSTFHVRFGDRDYDESPYARQVARQLGTRHHEIEIENGPADLGFVEDVQRQFDQPFGDSSAIPSYLICRAIRDHVKVAIAGDGGDEMFGGYPRFRYADAAHQVGRLPRFCLQALDRAAVTAGRWQPNPSRRVHRFIGAAKAGKRDRLVRLSCFTEPDELGQVVSCDAQRDIAGYQPSLSAFADNGRTDGLHFRDATIRYALPGDYLRKVDVSSNAHGLEVRVPMLGEHVLEHARRLPRRLLYSTRGSKLLLRELAGRLLPPDVAAKPKAGFEIPLDTWLGERGRCALADRLSSPQASMAPLIRPEYRQTLLTAFAAGDWDRRASSRRNLYSRVYLLWTLETWLQAWNPEL